MQPIARILLFAESIWAFGAGLFLPIFAIFSAQVGGDIVDAGIAAALFLFVTSILELPIGKLLDKYKEKWFLVADYFLEGLIFIGYAFVENKWQLFALQVALGLANALGDPSWESLFDRHTPNRRSGSAWALSHFFPGYLTAFGIIVGTLLIKGFGFRAVFLLGSVFAFIAGIVSLTSIKK